MKITLIMLVVIAAVAIVASADIYQESFRRRRASGVDIDETESTAEGKGYHVAAETGMIETQDETAYGSRASAEDGHVRTTFVKKGLRVRKTDDEKNTRAQRGISM